MNLPGKFDRIIVPEFDYCTFIADSRKEKEELEKKKQIESEDKARAEKEEIERKKKEELEKVNQSESKISTHISLANNKFVGDEVNIWVLKSLLKHKYNKNKIAGQLGQLDGFKTNARLW